jgi:hypothetical protein
MSFRNSAGFSKTSTIDSLAESINQALNEPKLAPKNDAISPNLKLATEAEKETVKQFTNAKDNLLRNIKMQYAHNAKAFDAYMKKIYGENYNKTAAERIRQKILAGDESWLPKIEYLSEEELQGHLRAVDPSSEVIYFSNEFFRQHESETYTVLNYEKTLWAALADELDPQDANNLQGRSFGTIYVNGKPIVVEWIAERPPQNVSRPKVRDPQCGLNLALHNAD